MENQWKNRSQLRRLAIPAVGAIAVFSILAIVSFAGNWHSAFNNIGTDALSKSREHIAQEGSLDIEAERPIAGESELPEDSLNFFASDRGWVFSASPLQAYLRYLPRANAGDAQAQLYLSMIIERCSHISARSEKQLDELYTLAQLPTGSFEEIARTFAQCRGLYGELRDYELKELQAFWLKSATEDLDVARVRQIFAQVEIENSDELYPLLIRALEESLGNPVLEASAIQSAQAYFRYFVEPKLAEWDAPEMWDPGYYRRAPDSLAWEYIECAHSLHCDLSSFVKLVERHYYEYEIDYMQRRAEEILNAIREREWKKLALKP